MKNKCDYFARDSKAPVLISAVMKFEMCFDVLLLFFLNIFNTHLNISFYKVWPCSRGVRISVRKQNTRKKQRVRSSVHRQRRRTRPIPRKIKWKWKNWKWKNEQEMTENHLLCISLSKMADVVREDGEVVWHLVVLAEVDDDRQADSRCWIFGCWCYCHHRRRCYCLVNNLHDHPYPEKISYI